MKFKVSSHVKVPNAGEELFAIKFNFFFLFPGREERNLKCAFKATGIYPLDRKEALKRIPGGLPDQSPEEVLVRVSESFVEQLQVKR